jgi:hypothetical protein
LDKVFDELGKFDATVFRQPFGARTRAMLRAKFDALRSGMSKKA